VSDEFVEGYRDGRNPDSPEASTNRSHSYRHSFAVGRAELEGSPIRAETARQKALEAEAKDLQA
jgi:hypothetical protein